METIVKTIIKDPDSFEDADIYLLSTIGSVLSLYDLTGAASKFTQVFVPKITCTAAELIYPDLLSAYLEKNLCVTILGYDQVYHLKNLSLCAKPLYTHLNKDKHTATTGVLRHNEAPFGDVSWLINGQPISNYTKVPKVYDKIPEQGMFHISLALNPSYFLTHELFSLLKAFIKSGFHIYLPQKLDNALHFLHNAEVLDSSPQVYSMPSEPSKEEKKNYDDNELKKRIFNRLQKREASHYGDIRTWPDWDSLALNQNDDYVREPMPKKSLVQIYDKIYSRKLIDNLAAQTKVVIVTLRNEFDDDTLKKFNFRNFVKMTINDKIGAAEKIIQKIELEDKSSPQPSKIFVKIDELIEKLRVFDPELSHDSDNKILRSKRFLIYYSGRIEKVEVTKSLCDEFSLDIFSSTNSVVSEEDTFIVESVRFFCSENELAVDISKLLRNYKQ